MSGLEEFGDGKQLDAGKVTRGRSNPEPKEDCIECEPKTERREQDKLKRDQWSVVSSGKYLASSLTIKTLLPGVYTFRDSPIGILMCENPLNTDDLISFPDSASDNIEKEVDKFWDMGDPFKKYGFLHRRGYLLYGPAGSGKSCLVQRIIKNVINRKGIVFICSGHPRIESDGLKIFREVEPDRSIVCVFEDIDAIVANWGEPDVLMLLDGENQVDKVINIATTNYPERLDKRIVARPRRFDRVIKVDMPNEDIRRVYFQKKLGFNGEDIDIWVERTRGFSFASLCELVISVKCLGNGFEDSIKRLKEITTVKRSSTEFDDCKMGFESDRGELI